MDTNKTLLGAQSPGDELEIRDLRRIAHEEEWHTSLLDESARPTGAGHREVFLDAWSGETANGHPVFVAYRFGELTIDVDLPTANGGRSPLTVLRWKPRYSLALVTPRRMFQPGTSHTSEEQVRLAEVNSQTREIRAQNGKPTLLSAGELRHWLAERNRYFDLLRDRGLAGGKLRFRLVSTVQENAQAS